MLTDRSPDLYRELRRNGTPWPRRPCRHRLGHRDHSSAMQTRSPLIMEPNGFQDKRDSPADRVCDLRSGVRREGALNAGAGTWTLTLTACTLGLSTVWNRPSGRHLGSTLARSARAQSAERLVGPGLRVGRLRVGEGAVLALILSDTLEPS
jgi:hypothetical protein